MIKTNDMKIKPIDAKRFLSLVDYKLKTIVTANGSLITFQLSINDANLYLDLDKTDVIMYFDAFLPNRTVDESDIERIDYSSYPDDVLYDMAEGQMMALLLTYWKNLEFGLD